MTQIIHLGFLADTSGACSNGYGILVDRPLCITDAQVRNDPQLNPRWFAPGSREMGNAQSDEAFALALYNEKSIDRLYAILNGWYLLLVDGQIIHAILTARGAWDDGRIGSTSSFVPCGCEPCRAVTPPDRVRATIDEWKSHFDETLTALKRSAA